MSITGKNNLSIRKLDVKESKSLSNGFTKVIFAHEAQAGETGINLSSITTPSSMLSLGFTNPSPQRLLETRLFQFQDNLTLMSSLRGTLIKNLSYRVTSNSQIVFEGFTAQQGEIFTGIIDSNPVSGIQVIDAKTPVSRGDLAIGVTDFPIGFSTSTTKEEILVYRNGLQQKRNTNNSSTVLDGNYYVVDSGSGYGNLIRFNTAPSTQDDYVLVTAIGGVVDSPTVSAFDEIEKVQGQVDRLIPTVASLAGVPETDFQAAPNSIDMRQFGDVVVSNTKRIEDLEALPSVISADAGQGVVAFSTAFPAVNTWYQRNSITVPPGTWLISAGWHYNVINQPSGDYITFFKIDTPTNDFVDVLGETMQKLILSQSGGTYQGISGYMSTIRTLNSTTTVAFYSEVNNITFQTGNVEETNIHLRAIKLKD